MGGPVRPVQALGFKRPAAGIVLPSSIEPRLPVTSAPAWRSNGGPTRNHPARSWPNSFEAPIGKSGGVKSLHVLGVLAQFAGPGLEVPGTLGASLQLIGDGAILFRKELVNGRHYGDASDLLPVERRLGAEGRVQSLGTVSMDESLWRVDLLTLELERPVSVDLFKWTSLSSPASFSIFDVFVESTGGHPCPFHSGGGGVPLNRIAAIVRLGDRVEFNRAVDQLESSISSATDLDEARGEALTFLAAVTAALLESGGSRSLVREQLLAARELDSLSTSRDIALAIRCRIEAIVPTIFQRTSAPSDDIVDRALQLVETNYTKSLSDAGVAQELGLSASHFRFLFRQATGQPFHQYLIAFRLEKARELLTTQRSPVGDVAAAVGFGALSHFSRSFTQRFGVSPTHIRRGGR